MSSGVSENSLSSGKISAGATDYRRRLTPAITTVLSFAALVIAWHISASLWPSRSFPTPLSVFQTFLTETASGDLPYHLGITLWRVAASFFLAMIIGSAIGIFLGSKRRADQFFNPWVTLFLNIPALVVIVLAYVWFGLNEAAAIGAVAVNKIPNVIVTMREGARAIDPRYSEMATVYRFGPLDRLRHVVLPQLQPYFAAASRSGISLIWKIVLVVELLGRSNGVGFQINLFFQLFDVAAILAYTLAFVAVMLLIEYIVVQPLEHASTRWRRRAA
ncbi:ABC transporter permease [Phyllobacterium phragmitis]|uniref:ABC transporter permease n=2 Tax=Phyllobacterium phragmitis TaxID=2670329 RepID=A0A2S9ILP8_9HYPH|nr:ABC transporter permease [Phyllobacterium phragmitis]